MKKIIPIIAILTLFAAIAYSQNTVTTSGGLSYTLYNNIPRTATPPNAASPYDNTYRPLAQVYDSTAEDVAGLDTIYVTPTQYKTVVFVSAVLDSFCLGIPAVTGAQVPFKDDILEVIINNSSTGVSVHFEAADFKCAHGTIGGGTTALYLTASHSANITFRYDGTKWVEFSRESNVY